MAAAAAIFGAVIVSWLLLDSEQGVVLADVLAKAEQVQAFMYKMNMKITASLGENMPAINQDMEMTIIVSNARI